MAQKLTFIHAGDVHLGAPFRGLRALSPAWADRLVRAIPEALDRVIDACIKSRVDFLLLAGDVFDTDKPSYAHYAHLMKGLKRLEAHGICVYMIAGNHDPFANWKDIIAELPANVVMFPSDKPGFTVHEKHGEPLALIAARGFTNLDPDEDIACGMTRAEAEQACGVQAPFAVGMLHTGLWMDPHKAPTSEKRLLAAGMDYWALGHIHKRYCVPEINPSIAFCGCIQGRDIRETGARGCWKVTLEEGLPPAMDFIATASVEWEMLDVDISECVGLADVQARCVRALFDANAKVPCEEMIARITLVGQTPLCGLLSASGTLEDMRAELNESYPSFYCDALVNAATHALDTESLAQGGLFVGAFMDAMSESRQGEEDLLAYLQQEFGQRGLTLPQGIEANMEELSHKAQDTVLSLLLKGEG